MIFFLLLASLFSNAQRVVFSEPTREDIRDMNFEIIGKVKTNILVFHDVKWKYAVNVYNDSMRLLEKTDIDFLPKKTFNADFVAYPDFFYLIYQYQNRGIVYCMAVKLGADGKKINEPVQLDTTDVGGFGDNKIYSVIYSEDKQKIMVFKIQRKNDKFNFVTLLLDNQLQLIHKTRQVVDLNDRNDIYTDFLLDNEGSLVFAGSVDKGIRKDPKAMYLFIKRATEDTFEKKEIELKDAYLDEVKLKVDNVNKKYLINTFYYREKRGNIQGIYCNIWDEKGDSSYAHVYAELGDSLRSLAKSSGSIKAAFDDFFIRNITLKKDGSFILTAENFTSQTTGLNNGWNRYDYLFNSPGFNTYDYYYYNNGYGTYYRPFGSFANQSTRYYYDNVLILAMSKNGIPEWSDILHKQQYDDDNDNYLSFGMFITGGGIHLLYNDISKRNKFLSENVIGPDGKSKRNPTIKTTEREYEFMPKYSKQVGARQVIVPCTYRSNICFAKIDF